MSSRNEHTGGPLLSDMQLMHLLDGEHPEDAFPDTVEVLRADADIAEKLSQLELVGSLVAESVDADERADGITELVMARILAEQQPASSELPLATRTELPLPSAAAANDNARRIFALAAAAAAVAAGLFLWGQGSRESVLTASQALREPVGRVVVAEAAPETRSDERGGVDDASDTEDTPVEIAAVDFGHLTGAVFYVPGEEAGASTAVVWVTDSGDDQ